MLKLILYSIFLCLIVESYGQRIENVSLKIESTVNEYIIFVVENKSDFPIQIGNPECWTNLQTFLTTNSEEIPIAIRYKQNIGCINDLTIIEKKCKGIFKIKYKIGKLYPELKGEEEIELIFFGLIISGGVVIKEYGTIFKSDKVSLNKINR
jgi:hypothetical protein